MLWCRFEVNQTISFGIVEGDQVTQVEGSPFDQRNGHTVTSTKHPLSQVKLLAPVIPPMLYAAGPNYKGHVEGMAARRGTEPRYPGRPSPNYRSVHAIIGTEENIVVPKDCGGAVQPEGQLAVVIGKTAKKVSKVEALDHVFGYTIGNDISERPWQTGDRTFFRGKNCDTFNPLGPWIATGLDPNDLRVTVRHNGQVWEDFSSADMISGVASYIEVISEYSTLGHGDVIWMGTEGACGDMVPGDTIEVEISGIGTLKNYVVAEG